MRLALATGAAFTQATWAAADLIARAIVNVGAEIDLSKRCVSSGKGAGVAATRQFMLQLVVDCVTGVLGVEFTPGLAPRCPAAGPVS